MSNSNQQLGRAQQLLLGEQATENDSLDQLDEEVGLSFVIDNQELAKPVAVLHAALRSGDLCCEQRGEQLFIDGRAVWRGSLEQWERLQELGVVVDDSRVYLPKAWEVETLFLMELQRINSTSPQVDCSETAITEALAATPLTSEQQNAVQIASRHSLSILSGGPGSGKSFTAGWLVKILTELAPEHFEVVVAAPTGKAAARLQRSLAGLIDVEATTLHRLLGRAPGMRVSPSYLTADLLLVDECSMLDASLITHLLQSVKPGARLVMLGDSNQLPPVDSGSLFHDLVESSVLGEASFALPGSQRTNSPELLQLAEAAREGIAQPLIERVTHPLSEPSVLYSWLHRNALPELQGDTPEALLDSMGQRRILSPLRKGPMGTEKLNELCYQWVMEKGLEKLAIPLMVTRNLPHLGLYNGDTGVAIVWNRPYRWLFPFRQGEMAYFPTADDGVRELPAQLLPAVELAFCLSVHKSQGSEWEEVTLVFPEGSEVFGRSALYTGITRARSGVQLAADAGALESACRNRGIRRSGVVERLDEGVVVMGNKKINH